MPSTQPTPKSWARLDRDERRSVILASAEDSFAEHGYHKAAMDDIARRSGVSKPILYQFFSGKRELYIALLKEHADRTHNRLTEALNTAPTNSARVHLMVETTFIFADEHPQGFRLIFDGDLVNDPEVDAIGRYLTDTSVAHIAPVFAAQAGVSAHKARLVATAVVLATYASAREWLDSGRKLPRDEAAQAVTQFIFRGMASWPIARVDGI